MVFSGGSPDRKAIYEFGLLKYPALRRVVERVARGSELTAWGLGAMSSPGFPAPGSSLALDDSDALPYIPPKGVLGAAAGPVMWATDNLSSLHVLIDQVSHTVPFNHRSASFMSLCRSAFECSAQTIWILSSPDQEVRRRRAAGMSRNNLGDAKRYLDAEVAQASGEVATRTVERDEVGTWIRILSSMNPQQTGPTARVEEAAQWVAANTPRHLVSEFGSSPVAPRVSKQYNVCSSFSHGHTWPALLVAGDLNAMFAMMADAVAVAVYVTECAVALIESQARRGSGPHPARYPARLQSTIEVWTSQYAP